MHTRTRRSEHPWENGPEKSSEERAYKDDCTCVSFRVEFKRGSHLCKPSRPPLESAIIIIIIIITITIASDDSSGLSVLFSKWMLSGIFRRMFTRSVAFSKGPRDFARGVCGAGKTHALARKL